MQIVALLAMEPPVNIVDESLLYVRGALPADRFLEEEGGAVLSARRQVSTSDGHRSAGRAQSAAA
jgi:hypothetical protein